MVQRLTRYLRLLAATLPTALVTTRITSGKAMLTTTSWTVPPAKWLKICGKANPQLFIKVLGKTAGTKNSEFSETQAITVK